MKKFFGVMLAIIAVLFCFTACGGNANENNGNNGGNGGGSDIGGGNSDIGGGNSDIGSGTDGEETDTPPTNGEILIVYFSCTDTTKGIALHIQAETKGTLYKIVPEVPYTPDDLKYYTNCRADREQADSSARPAINGSVDDMDKYDVVFLGYPIWHGQAPRIISTFLESYDFSGKTVVPFCTSQSSGIGSSDTSLHALAPDAVWKAGRRFAAGTAQTAVADWINGLNITLTPSDKV